MDVVKLFNDLESNNSQEVEDTKQKLTENFSLTKEPWLVQGMMEYFGQTNSIRIVDILVKVQSPHDRHIFDRLCEWLRNPNKQHALNLFGHIVRKHPTWLHKIAQHQLMKDLLKLLRTDKDIISIMSALLCLINLLPIIPSLMVSFLPDIFEVFSHLAAWNCQKSTNLSEDILFHLQIGLYRLFHRLYGMFPCNFLVFLRQEYVVKEKTAIFSHTIKPLLDTVKINPLLITGDKDSELNPMRWKKMEPHDVVFECSKFSLDYFERAETSDCQCHNSGTVRTVNYNSTIMETPATLPSIRHFSLSGKPQFFTSSEQNQKLLDYSRHENIWSPSVMILATPPPTTSAIPHTPQTPNISSISVSSISDLQLTDSSSPPEAAIEATPETTPMKDNIKSTRNFPSSSSAVRSIWGVTSQPSSPMKKDLSPFRFPDNVNTDASSYSSTQKITRIVNDQNHSLPNVHSHPIVATVESISSIPNSPLPEQLKFNELKIQAGIILQTEISQEDQEVREINSSEFTSDCKDCENQGTCTAGGLHMPNTRSMIDYRRRNRIRMYSHCLGDTCYSAVASPADSNAINLIKLSRHKIKRFNSCPDLRKMSSFFPILNKIDKNGISDTINNKLQHKTKCVTNSKMKKEVSTQTIQQWPQIYEHMFFTMFSEENKIKKLQENSNLLTPHVMLEQNINISIKKKYSTENRNWEEMYRDHIKLLNLQLQYERHRREVHAERNRRLLGKSRAQRSLEQHNETLRDQVNRLSIQINFLNNVWNNIRKSFNSKEQDLEKELNVWKIRYQNEIEETKKLRLTIENLQLNLSEEMKLKKKINTEIETARGELFDLRNDMRQALYQADLGQQYRDELTRLQSEMILMGELQLKCKEKLCELTNLKARDIEMDIIQKSYAEDIKDCKYSLDIKCSQLDTTKARLSELESQLSKRDGVFTELKCILKAVKEEYQEKFNSLEKKYAAQKAIILRLEEHILELYKNQTAVNLTALSPDSDRTDMVGSLDHTSPLSLSLSSEGLSASLRSVTEIKNLQALVVEPNTISTNNRNNANVNTINVIINSRQTGVSDDIPVPGPSQHHKHL